jgi:hypothetical protein
MVGSTAQRNPRVGDRGGRGRAVEHRLPSHAFNLVSAGGLPRAARRESTSQLPAHDGLTLLGGHITANGPGNVLQLPALRRPRTNRPNRDSRRPTSIRRRPGVPHRINLRASGRRARRLQHSANGELSKREIPARPTDGAERCGGVRRDDRRRWQLRARDRSGAAFWASVAKPDRGAALGQLLEPESSGDTAVRLGSRSAQSISRVSQLRTERIYDRVLAPNVANRTSTGT